MKRRNLILGFVIVALLLVGIGYAAVSDRVKATGEVNVATDTLTLQFVESANEDFEYSDAGDMDVATLKAAPTLSKNNQTVSYVLVIENTSDYDATLVVTPTFTSNYATMSAELASLDATEGKLKSGATVELTITFTFTKSPLTAQNDLEFSVLVVGTPVER